MSGKTLELEDLISSLGSIVNKLCTLRKKKKKKDGCLLNHVQLCVMPWTVACQATLPMKVSRQEYWNGLRFLLQGIFLTQGLNPGLMHCGQILYHLSHEGNLR